jgi:tRNA(fMet)-specific endonuclease VapC
MLSLDTSTAIDIMKMRSGRETRARFAVALDAGQRICVSSLVVHELMVGSLKSARPSEHMQRVDNLLTRLEVVDFSADDAISAARLRSELEGAGRSIGALDTLIAGQALARDWTVVTKDVKHFLRVDGLTIIDWTRSDQPLDRPDLAAQLLRLRPKEDK